MRTKKMLSLFTIVLGVLLALSACQTPTQLPQTTPEVGQIEGTISDSATGKPIVNALVTIAGNAGVFTISSDAQGKYAVDDIAAGAYLVNVQAMGYYINAIQVGIVANILSTGNVALDPETVTIITATPPPPPTPCPISPACTPVASATPTAVPTATPTAMPTPKKQTASPAPRVRYTAPTLVEPHDYAQFRGPRRITFEWEGPCCIAANEYFVISIPHPHGAEEAWVKGTSWTSPDYLYLLVPESRQLTWSVSIRRHTGEYPNGQWKGPTVSPISQVWHFTWHKSGEGDSRSPIPTPVSPLSVPNP